MMKKRGTIDTMKKILDLITEEMEQAFADAGYEKELARVTLSNRPDLCEYQCTGRDTVCTERFHLVLHQGNERRNHYRRAFTQ